MNIEKAFHHEEHEDHEDYSSSCVKLETRQKSDSLFLCGALLFFAFFVVHLWPER